MTRLLKACLFSLFLLTSLPAMALVARSEPEGPYVQVRLLPEGTLRAGEEITIAIEQSIAPGWHTYWKNPGDSGAAPRVKWTLPNGFEARDIEWPVPHKLPYGPLLNYGYENNVILLQKIQAPGELPDGPITLKADIDILVCMEICIPESGTYELTLNAAESNNADNSDYFENARAKMPIAAPGASTYSEVDGNFIIDMPVTWSQGVARYDYIPGEWGMVENTAPSDIKVEGGRLTITQKRGTRKLDEVSAVPGLLLWDMDESGPMNAYSFTATITADVQTATPVPPPPGAVPNSSLLAVLAFALLGGLILNLMPCVFPVLSIKAISLVKIAEKSPGLARTHGLAYTGGVILSFLAIAGILIALKSGGAQIGWGFQLQSPEIVTALAWLFFIIGLNLSGIFEIGGHLGNVGNRLTQGNTPVHSFFTGVLATLVATPCTAPFMAAALGYALVQPAAIALLVFAALGLGLALPYLALSFIPALQKILPKPGAWMDKFKQLLAFPMYASAAWLVWVLSQQSGPMGVFAALMGLVLIAFGIWLLRHMPASKIGRWFIRVLAVIAFASAIVMIPDSTPKSSENVFGEAWSPLKLAETLEGNDPVFVEMTAAWCITCKVNHALAIDVANTRRVFEASNVKYLIGDWTNQDPDITEYLTGFGRNGVPIYVYYGPRGSDGERPEPVVLPQILTPGIVAKTVTRG